MNLALWIAAIVLAVGFAASGLMKLLVPKDKLVEFGQGWAQDVSQSAIRLIGVAEVLAGWPNYEGTDCAGPALMSAFTYRRNSSDPESRHD